METIKKPDELDLDELLIYTKVDDPLVYSPRTLEAYPHQTLETNHLLRPPCSAVHREHRRGGFRVLRRFHAHALTIGKTKCQSCISRCMDKQSGHEGRGKTSLRRTSMGKQCAVGFGKARTAVPSSRRNR